jgi:hypothetical protein
VGLDVRNPDQIQTSALYFAGTAYADRRHRWAGVRVANGVGLVAPPEEAPPVLAGVG